MPVQVRIVNESDNPVPRYATEGAAGMDLSAHLSAPIELKPLERKLIATGLFIELPQGYEAQVRPRSGLALKQGLTVLNTPGTIDSDYRGEVGVILINLSNETQVVNSGDRIAQMVVHKVERVEFEKVDTLAGSERGVGGFGSTGKN